MGANTTTPNNANSWHNRIFGSSIAIILLSATPAFAPPPPPPPPPRDFSMDLALKAANATFDACKWTLAPIAVEVADREGTARVLLVMDGIDKYTIATMQRLVQSVIVSRAQSASTVPIWKGDNLIGVVSVGGGRFGSTATCAIAGAEKIRSGLNIH